MSQYFEWDNFKNVYLEDGFVIGIEESENQVSFTVEMVLTEDHPMYSLPHKGEQYCYKKGKIIFQELKDVKWLNRNMRPFTDADDDEDYGNIDSFQLSSEGYHLSGDWGEVIINSPPPKVEWLT
ncbi:hypothetical protein [Isoalcanivorax pacificus]|uniref:hypothetical protein n=1 Tax=Isoalcanivorax pacificus TaxID=1306787 RepID=UPI00118688C0|nr:hypothetical protein [Isoalcanivorax pacificus]